MRRARAPRWPRAAAALSWLLAAGLVPGPGPLHPALGPSPLAGQADTVQVRDTVPGVDRLPGDTLPSGPVADTLPDAAADGEPADSLVVRRLPDLPGALPTQAPGRVRWTRQDLLRARAVTLLELLAPLLGAVPLRTGDYGTPEGFVMDGMAGGRLRVFYDGVEEIPLDGSVVDLARISIGGMESVELDRTGGEIRIFLTPVQADEPGPSSLVEAGTGDLDGNLFRGTFVHPSAFGGGLGLVFERLDTRGPGGREEGSRQGFWVRYLRPVGSRLTVAAEVRQSTASSVLDRVYPTATRGSSVLRARLRLAESLVVEGFAARNSLDAEVDSLERATYTADQFGARVGWSLPGLDLRGAVRRISAERGPTLRADGDLTLTNRTLGGAAVRVGWDRWDTGNRLILGASAWSRPVLGFSLRGQVEDGTRGWAPPAPPIPEPPPVVQVPEAPPPLDGPENPFRAVEGSTDRRFLRVGARWQGGPLAVGGSWIRHQVDSVAPLGTRADSSSTFFAGQSANGWEADLSLALPVRGFSLVGSLQQWRVPGLFRPERIYRGGLTFNRTFYPSGGLEITSHAVVEGRDPMLLPIPDPEAAAADPLAPPVPLSVPFYQSWNLHLQIRVQTVRLFIRWDNFTVRDNLQDVPGRVLPNSRTLYGVRWTLRN